MPRKTYYKNGNTAKVTFELPQEVNAKKVCLLGEFNDWDEKSHVLKKRKDGRFSITVTLKKGEWQYRYRLDNDRWENDWDADGYVPNEFGTSNSVVQI